MGEQAIENSIEQIIKENLLEMFQIIPPCQID